LEVEVKFLILCSMLLLLLATACRHTPEAGSRELIPTTAFTHVNVVPMGRDTVLRDQTVLVRRGRIAQVGPAGEVRVPGGARIVEGTGKYLIPGLWDMHVHTLTVPDSLLGLERRAVELFFPVLLANGVTGVRDMGAPLDSILALRRRIRTDSLLAPRIVAAGPALSGPSPWGGAAGHIWRVQTPEEARQAVDSLHRAGVDFIKVHDFLPRDVYFAIAAEAERLRMPLVGHLRASVGPAEASDAGQVSIEHLAPEFPAYCAPDGEARADEFYAAWRKDFATGLMKGILELRRTRDPRTCAGLWAHLRRNGTWVVPTTVLRRQDSTFYSGPAASYLTPRMRALCDATIAQREPAGAALTEAFYRDMGAQVAEMHRAGVPLLAGADAGSGCLVPGFSLHDELEHLTEAGLTPFEALRTATTNPARFLGATDSLGTVEAGKVADLVLLDANPLEDIRNARRVQAVMRGGRLLDRSTLDALLARAQAIARPSPPN
jgi:imidazolonepropionase-like amidohydrolase